MSTSYPQYKVGDRLRVLKDRPWSAGFHKGDIIEITKAPSSPGGTGSQYCSAKRADNRGITWSVNNKHHGIWLEYDLDPNDLDYYMREG